MAKARILVVEDERIIAEDIKISLEEADYEVVAVESSADGAINAIRQHTPDLVLMDIMLKSEMDGVEAAGKIRSQYQIPLIYLTSHTDRATIERAKQTQPYGYLIKPFANRELDTTIEMALYKHQAEMEREHLLAELQEALAKVHTLEGLLPICAWCKKIRDDHGYWKELEEYIEHHSLAKFSHGICEECLAKKFPDFKQ
jgi:CheY-like chemotaxis protein